MQRLLVAALILLAADATAAGPSRIRRNVNAAQRSDCPPPWCEQTPTIHRLVAPDDPSLYLGDLISYERPSAWRDYPPLRDEVAALTEGLTTDHDKVVAVADWLKHFKPAGVHQYTSWPPSIIDIWGFDVMRCEEASFLLTAMLREAGIPAMRFVTWNDDHAAVRAYADGAWIAVDATPTTPDNSGPARVYAPDDPALIPAFQQRPVLSLANVKVPESSERIASFTMFDQEPLDESASLAAIGLANARIAFPVTNEFLAYDPQTHSLVAPGDGAEHVAILFHIDAVDAQCLNQRRSWYATPIAFIEPGPLWRTIDPTQPPWVGTFYPLGYIETILPTCGTWRIVYYFDDADLNPSPAALAYADFDLGAPTGEVVIRPDMLQPEPGADMEAFQALVDALARVPSFEALGGGTPQ